MIFSFAGSAAAVTSVLLGYPFDTIKTRLQTGLLESTYRGLITTVQNDGFKVLYKGVLAPLIILAVKRGYQYSAFETINSKTSNPWISGAIAGGSGTIISCPMQILKTNMQSGKFVNIQICLKYVHRTYGWKGFYRGFIPNLTKDILFATMYLGTYDTLRNKFPNNPTGHFLSGGIASALTWSILFPFDTFKINSQYTNSNMQILKERIHTQGYRTLWKGLAPALLRIFPVSACSMVVYEYTKKLLKYTY